MNKQEIEQKATEYFDSLPEKDAYMMAFKAEVIEMITYFAVWFQGQQNQSGMRWVRASERLPKINTDVLIRTNAAKILTPPELYLGYLDEDIETKERFFVLVNFHHHEFDSNNWDVIFWLDESASSEVERLRKENEEMLEMLKECKIQIEYLHRKFQPTGTGEVVISRADSLIQKIEANGK